MARFRRKKEQDAPESKTDSTEVHRPDDDQPESPTD